MATTNQSKKRGTGVVIANGWRNRLISFDKGEVGLQALGCFCVDLG